MTAIDETTPQELKARKALERMPLGTPVWVEFREDSEYKHLAHVWRDGSVVRVDNFLGETPVAVRRLSYTYWNYELLERAQGMCWEAMDEAGLLQHLGKDGGPAQRDEYGVLEISDSIIPADLDHPLLTTYEVWGRFLSLIEDEEGWDPMFSADKQLLRDYKSVGGYVPKGAL